MLLQLVFSSVCWSRGWGGAGAITAGLLFSVLVLRLGRSWCYYSWSSLQCAGLEAGEELVLLQLVFSLVCWSRGWGGAGAITAGLLFSVLV